MRISSKALGIRIGLAYTVAFALLSFGCWKEGFDAYYRFLRIFTFTPTLAALLLGLGWWWRSRREGPVPFLLMLQYTFLAYLTFEVGYALVTVILYNYLDPNLGYQVLKRGIEHSGPAYSSYLNQRQNTDTSAGQVVLGIGIGLVEDFVKSCVLSIVLQRK